MELEHTHFASPLFMPLSEITRPDAMFRACCRHCEQKFAVEDAVAFTDFNCPHCHTPLIVPKIFSDYWLFDRRKVSERNRIYRALDPLLDRVVAIKVAKPDKTDADENRRRVRRLYYDAQIQSQLECDNVMEIYRCSCLAGREAKVMELLTGGGLHFNEDPALRTDELLALSAICSVAELLQCAAEFNIVHGQISPDNLRFNRIGVLKLLNFRPPEDFAPEVSWPEHEFIYLSPERLLNGEATVKADIYSLAVILYQLLSNLHPMGFLEPGLGELDLVNRQQRNPVPSLKNRAVFNDDELFSLISAMLSPHPEERPEYTEIIQILTNATRRLARKRNLQTAVKRLSEKLHAGIQYVQTGEFPVTD